MKSLLLMITYFTRIRIKYNHEYKDSDFIKGIKLFPIIGLIIGFIMYIPVFLKDIIHIPVIVLFSWLIYIWITGGLHIDGLGDTFDGIFSNRDKSRILEIMRDSRIGTFGVLGIILLIIWNLVLTYYIDLRLLIIVPVVGRSAAILSAAASKYAREGQGMGKAFIENCRQREVVFSLIFVIGLSFIIGYPVSLIALLPTLALALSITKYINNKIGGSTGDTIGFIIEISQSVFILFTYIIKGIIG